MSFKLLKKLPSEAFVAVSGGVDSVSVLHWLTRYSERVKGIVHFNHGTGDFANKSQLLVTQLAEKYKIPFHVRTMSRKPNKGESLENHWREQRYRWFKELSAINNNIPIILGHNFDDCLEEYIMATMVRGFSGSIPYSHGPCIRPFRLWKRKDIKSYAFRNNLNWVEDPSNQDLRFKRSYIRKEIIPNILKLNPGVYNIVEKIIREQDV